MKTRLCAIALGATALIPGVAAQQPGLASHSSFGAGCPGGGSLTATGLPEFGRRSTIALDGARPSAPAFLLLGLSSSQAGGVPLPLDLTSLGAPGCVLLTSIDDTIASSTDPLGSARTELLIPQDPTLAGVHVYAQWLVVDPGANQLGIALSDAGDSTLGFEPTLRLISVAPRAGGVGQEIEIVGNDFGDDPRDQCIRSMDPLTGAVALFLGTSLRTEPNGDRVLRARLVHAAPGFRQGPLFVHRGRNRTAPAGRTRSLSAPGEEWAWDGHTAAVNMAQVGDFTLRAPEDANTVDYVASWQNDGTKIYVDLPISDPCSTSGVFWPVGTRIVDDVHFEMTCAGGWMRHFDVFLDAVTVVRASTTGAQVGAEHAQQLGDVFDARYGGPVPITWTTQAGPPGFVRLCGVPDPACTLRYPYIVGKVEVDCPERSEALVLEGASFASRDLVRVDTAGNRIPIASALSLTADDVESSADGTRAVVTDGAFIRIIDVDSGTPSVVGATGVTSAGVRVTPRDQLVIFDETGGTQLQIRAFDGALLGSLTASTSFDRIGLSSGGGLLVLGRSTNADLDLVRISPLGVPTLVGSLSAVAGGGTQCIEFSPANDHAFCGHSDGSVTLLDFGSPAGFGSGAVVENRVIDAGRSALGVAVDSEGYEVFVQTRPAGLGSWSLWRTRIRDASSFDHYEWDPDNPPSLAATGGSSGIFLPVTSERYLGFVDHSRTLCVRDPAAAELKLFPWDGATLSAPTSYTPGGITPILSGFARRER
ncbi:MAG: hypothetical protein IPM29_22245 [Planctomycetes bacterium]|nr:hypothetical protein [Planctomycetota bacterium]